MKLKFNNKHITLVVITHSIADCIESYATDYKLTDLVELSSEIREKANRYGNDFVELSEYFEQQVSNLGYNKRQMLPVLCYILHREAKKIRDYFLNENPRKEYTQMETAIVIRDYFKGEFISKEMISKVSDIILEIRKNHFI